MATQPDPEITYTATGQGYYRVHVDGVEVSKHTQEREAVEAAAAWKAGWPNAEVRYTHDYTVEVTMPGLVMDPDAPGPFTPPAETSNPPAQPDPADMDITQVSSTSTEVTYELTWGDVAGEAGYEWKAGGDSGEWRIPSSGYNSLGAGVTSVQFTVERRTNDVDSFACVRSFNENGSSSDGCIGFTLPAAEASTAPDAPTGLSADAVSAGRIDLDWTGSSGAEQYKVHRSTTQGFTVSSSNRITTVSATSYSDTGVVGDTTYYYRVVASNSVGDSDPSNEASATTPQDTTDEGALLTDATPSNFSVPSGWITLATEDFEDETNLSGTHEGRGGVVTSRAHSGSQSLSASIRGDGHEVGIEFGPIAGREVYVSWYEYLSPAASFNTETWFGRVTKRTSDGFAEVIMNFFGTGSTGFNSPEAFVLFVEQATLSTGSYAAWDNHKLMTRPVGQWVQYEWYFKADDPGQANGESRFWRNGSLILEATGANFMGDFDFSGFELEVKYLYTRHNWYTDAPENTDCSDNIGVGKAIAEEDGTQSHRCFFFPDSCACDPPEDHGNTGSVQPSPSEHRVWMDDIIVLEK